MPDLLKSGSDWLADQQKSFVSQAVTYKRGSDSVAVAATIGRTVFEIDAGDGQFERFEARDYLIHAADLVLDSTTVEPKRGDRIEEMQASTTFVYEVMSPANQPVWRYSDAYRKRLRIHTKLISP